MNQVFLQADNLFNNILFSKKWLVRLDLKKLLITYDLGLYVKIYISALPMLYVLLKLKVC